MRGFEPSPVPLIAFACRTALILAQGQIVPSCCTLPTTGSSVTASGRRQFAEG